MISPRPITIAATVATLTLGAGLAACGSSPSSSTTAAATTQTTPATTATAPAVAAVAVNGKITVEASEYAFAPTTISAKPGKVLFTLDNKGRIPHELIVLKTSADPGTLKVDPAAVRISESASVGEVSETAAGQTKTTALDLKAGRYVFVCDIPTHYSQGMYGVLTVKSSRPAQASLP